LLGRARGGFGSRSTASSFFTALRAESYSQNGCWKATAAWLEDAEGTFPTGRSTLGQIFVITGMLIGMMFIFARQRGFSPLEMVSSKADAIFVRALRTRFPLRSAN